MRKNRPKNILVINPFGIGDVLFSTPAVEALRRNFPDAYIAYICNIRTKELLETNPFIDEIFVFEKDEYRLLWKQSKKQFFRRFKDFLKMIRQKKFDLAVDYSMGHQYSLILWFLGVKNRIGFNYKGRGRFLTRSLDFLGFDDKSIASYYLDVLRLIGIEADGAGMMLETTKEDDAYIDEFLGSGGVKTGANIVCIAPGGGVSFGKDKMNFKRWPIVEFAQLSDKIIDELQSTVIFVLGPKEEGLIKDITSKMHNVPVIAPKTTVRQMASLMRRCKVCVCNDAGPLHVAVSQGCSTVSIFGPSDARSYGPYPLNEKHKIVTSTIKCRPCYKRFKLPDCSHRSCLESVSVDNVFMAVKKQLAVKE